jgi:hypothetical protein
MGLDCVFSSFKDWLKDRGEEFPVEEDRFDSLIGEYAVSDMAQMKENYLGFINNKLVYASIHF